MEKKLQFEVQYSKAPLPKGGCQNGIKDGILTGGFAAGSNQFAEMLGEFITFYRESLRAA